MFAAASVGAMGEVVKIDLMPLASYKLLHPRAKLQNEHAEALSRWATTERLQNLKDLRKKAQFNNELRDLGRTTY